ncbi:MAG: nucleotidyltransferase family protein, partial [Clostridia bacterium]|nr:nucleotidyltransferase family protein [Clostridia bacterium]
MNILGIISEYNPFHNGHLYHLNEAKKLTNAKGVVCVMSGNFMQRGEPALVNKWARAKMAINNGVDLVFELPVLYATQSAYWFAKGGIETLAATGIVSHLAFGVEATNPSALSDIAQILAKEPVQYQNTLKQYLKEGLSFPQARAQALSKEISFDKQLLETPNNVLAIS